MKVNNEQIERYRVIKGKQASTRANGNNGAFLIPVGSHMAFTIASDGGGWEHVSVSMRGRIPTWAEICQIKDLFWAEDEVVMQIHPVKKDSINLHPRCLHLWRPVAEPIPQPPKILV